VHNGQLRQSINIFFGYRVLENSFTVSSAAKLIGVKSTRISWLLTVGIIEPEMHKPNGSGDNALLGSRNIKEILLHEKMVLAGMKRGAIKKAMTMLKTSSMRWWTTGGWLVYLEKGEWFVTDNVSQSVNLEKIKNSGMVVIFKL